jgi:hypothetical protein
MDIESSKTSKTSKLKKKTLRDDVVLLCRHKTIRDVRCGARAGGLRSEKRRAGRRRRPACRVLSAEEV